MMITNQSIYLSNLLLRTLTSVGSHNALINQELLLIACVRRYHALLGQTYFSAVLARRVVLWDLFPTHSLSSALLRASTGQVKSELIQWCREEAESLFQTLDLSSEAATPRTLDHGRSPGSTPQSRLSEFGGPQSPVNLNDANFPSLASAGLKQVWPSPEIPYQICGIANWDIHLTVWSYVWTYEKIYRLLPFQLQPMA